MPKIDWDQMIKTDEAVNTPAPAGRYVIACESGKWGATKEGHPMMTLRFRVDEGPCKGKAVWVRCTFNNDKPNTISMSRTTLKNVGLDFSDFRALSDEQQEQIVVGRKAEVELSVRSWQGRNSNEVKNWIRPVTGGTGPSLSLVPPPVTDEDASVSSVSSVSSQPAPRNPLADL